MEREIKRRSFLKNLFSLSAFIAGSHLSLKMDKSCEVGRISQTTALGIRDPDMHAYYWILRIQNNRVFRFSSS